MNTQDWILINITVLMYLLICDFFIICIFVFELKNILKTLHVPAHKENHYYLFAD